MGCLLHRVPSSPRVPNCLAAFSLLAPEKTCCSSHLQAQAVMMSASLGVACNVQMGAKSRAGSLLL